MALRCTIGRSKGQPNYSYGGVVYPGCSPFAAGGGNWNVVDHATLLHFQGQTITVTSCTPPPTGSPKVAFSQIDFTGFGTISINGSDPTKGTPVTFVGRAYDKAESGSGSD